MPKVVIADDEEFVRYFLRTMMESIYFNVVEEVDSGDKLPDVMAQQEPDILLLDINMPNLTGEEFLKGYSYLFPKTCIIILTSVASAELLNKNLMKDASCFLRKDTPPEKMIEIIQNTWTEFRMKNR